MKKVVLTGDRPSGRLHLGHYIGSLKKRVELQQNYNQFIMIADVQALTDNFTDPEKIRNNIIEVTKDYLSVGIDSNKTKIFIQSQIPQIAELTIYYLNLVTMSRIERNPTIKSEIKQKNFGDSIPVGFFCYPINQAADITIFQSELVPVGDDQLPMIEQTNEIVRKFNRIYNGDFLRECQPILSKTSRLIGIDGKSKASKSLNNAIYLSDSPTAIKEKVFQMYTDSNHIKVSDPGKVEGNVVFAYLEAFHHDIEEVKDLQRHYQRGGLGDVTIKNILNKSLQNMIEPIRERRSKIENQEVMAILENGTKHAFAKAEKTIIKVRKALKLNYFD